MIDNERQVHDLIEALNGVLPTQAYATPALVQAVGKRSGVNVNDPVTIDSVLYLGDEGGIACVILHLGGKSVVSSITHLRFDQKHPLSEQIRAYQSRRAHRLAGSAGRGPENRGPENRGPKNRGPAKARAGLATKTQRRQGRSTATKKGNSADVDRRFRAGERWWSRGEYERAANAHRDVLKLDPDDSRFARYYLASCLFQMAPSDELDRLLQRHDDHTGGWRFAQALQAFRRKGDSEDSQRLLVEAHHLEPGFEDYLLRDKVVDARREMRFDRGDAQRAFACARLFLPAWRGVPGAVSWARRILKVPLGGGDPHQVPRRFPLQELQALPQRRETWQLGLIPSRDESEGEPSPIWLFGVANVAGQEVRALTVIEEPVTEVAVWNALISSFLRPLDGEPARPHTLIVCRRDFRDGWKSLLSKIGIECRYKSNPQPVGNLLEAMRRIAQQPALPPADEIDIQAFPQTDAIWQADFLRSPAWVSNEQEGSYRPWSVLVLDKSRSNALKTAHTPGDPAPEMLLEFLVQTMAQPGNQPRQRPRLVEVSDSDCYDFLRPRLEAAGITCRLVDELTEFNDFCLALARSFDGSEKCALADGRGVTRAQMESFYEAAAYYFRQAPWRRVAGEIPIKVRCDDPDLGTRYAIVLGRTGVQLGLCVYDDWETTQAMLCGYAAADESRVLAAIYDEPEIMAAVDLQLIDRLGWPIATPEAWPAVMRLQPYQTPRSPTAEELVFLDALLRAIPDFIKSQAASQHCRVETGTRPVELHLEWQAESPHQ